MSQGSEGYVVYACACHFGEVVESDAAAGLQGGASCRLGDGCSERVGGVVVEQDNLSADGECLVQFGWVCDFHLDALGRTDALECGLHGSGYAACCADMVVFDEDGIVQASAVVMAAAHANCVLFEGAVAGSGLARVED